MATTLPLLVQVLCILSFSTRAEIVLGLMPIILIGWRRRCSVVPVGAHGAARKPAMQGPLEKRRQWDNCKPCWSSSGGVKGGLRLPTVRGT